MKISTAYNRFLHGAVFNEIMKVDYLRIRIGNITRILPIKKNMDYLKFWLKVFNLDYPIGDNGVKYSTRWIDTKQTAQHIEWCIKIMGENGHELPFVREEWERLVNQYKG